MKGPDERLKYDLRRIWECPDCHHHEWSDGTVTAFFCRCQQKKELTSRVAMKLVEDGPRRRVKAVEAESSDTPEKPATSDNQTDPPRQRGPKRQRNRRTKKQRGKGKPESGDQSG